MTDVSIESQAQRLLAQLTDKADQIENILVLFSLKGQPKGTLTLGSTSHTPVMWGLGALDYARWHLFETLTFQRIAKDMVTAQAMQELKEHGGRPQ